MQSKENEIMASIIVAIKRLLQILGFGKRVYDKNKMDRYYVSKMQRDMAVQRWNSDGNEYPLNDYLEGKR